MRFLANAGKKVKGIPINLDTYYFCYQWKSNLHTNKMSIHIITIKINRCIYTFP